MLLYVYNPVKDKEVSQEDESGTVELIIAKHRNGGTGTVKLRWIGEYTTFVNIGEKLAPAKKREQIDVDKIEETPVENIGSVDVFD